MTAARDPATVFTSPSQLTTRPTLTGSFGMSASTHWIATATAQSVLERGGNAFDAAVAAGFVLHVAEPHLNGPGGDMVAMVAPAGRAPVVINAQGPAPAGATIEHFRREGLSSVPGSGALAAAVPGAVEGWLDILERYGTWTLPDVLEYVLHYADVGIEVGSQLAAVLRTMAPHFVEHWPTSASLWLHDGVPPAVGDLLGNTEYADTLRKLLAQSGHGERTHVIARFRSLWKAGFVAEQACSFVAKPHRHSSGLDHGGVLTVGDWGSFQVRHEPPVTTEFRGFTIAKAGFWSQGPVLIQALSILDCFDDDSRLDPSTVEGVHTIAEALKLAMADRDAYYGEGTPSVSLQEFLSRDYAKSRVALVGEVASTDFRPGVLPGVDPFVPPLVGRNEVGGPAANGGIGEPTMTSSGVVRGDTCHLDVVDRHGNMVSATPSGGWLQSSPAVPGLGLCLGTRLQMSWLDPRSPSALHPGHRPRTTLTPTMVLRDEEVVMAMGTPGGDQQDQWQLLYLLRVIAGGYEPQQAIDAPAFHTTALVSSFEPRVHQPAGLVIEDRHDAAFVQQLRDMGHQVDVVGSWSLGRLSSVSREPRTGTLSAAANSRGQQGYAAGR